eukprot:jgi/Psemu1/57387/gm1.57387_g
MRHRSFHSLAVASTIAAWQSWRCLLLTTATATATAVTKPATPNTRSTRPARSTTTRRSQITFVAKGFVGHRGSDRRGLGGGPEHREQRRRLYHVLRWEHGQRHHVPPVRAVGRTGPESDPIAVEVNYLETILIIYFDLTAGFAIDGFSTEKKVHQEDQQYERQSYEVFAYHCHPETYMARTIDLVVQGEVASICIAMEEAALKEGVKIERINFFEWSGQLYPGDPKLTQKVVENGVAGPTSSVDYFLDHVVLVESLIYADFFKTTGIVDGVGEVQFGFMDRRRSRTRRQLQLLTVNTTESREQEQTQAQAQKPRDLQQAQETLPQQAVPGEFGLTFPVAPRSARSQLRDTAGGVRWMAMAMAMALQLFGAWIVALVVADSDSDWNVLPVGELERFLLRTDSGSYFRRLGQKNATQSNSSDEVSAVLSEAGEATRAVMFSVEPEVKRTWAIATLPTTITTVVEEPEDEELDPSDELDSVSAKVTITVGKFVGAALGPTEGEAEGAAEGAALGSSLTTTTTTSGLAHPPFFPHFLSAFVGFVGAAVGATVFLAFFFFNIRDDDELSELSSMMAAFTTVTTEIHEISCNKAKKKRADLDLECIIVVVVLL